MEHNTPSAAQLQRETSPARLEAFSDSVLAVIITIMVLGLRPPLHDDLGSLKSLIPGLLIYVLSFTFIGIYWNNHHHLLRAARRISGGVMWANLHLLFWLSLVPVVTAWVGAHPHSTGPAVTYGAIGLLAGIAYLFLTLALRAVNQDTRINELLQRDTKARLSTALYTLGIVLAFIIAEPVGPLLAYGAYTLVPIMWLVPDRRFATASNAPD
jgi:uncharacterized membrane protein